MEATASIIAADMVLVRLRGITMGDGAIGLGGVVEPLKESCRAMTRYYLEDNNNAEGDGDGWGTKMKNCCV
jgi:hypothetical protein